MKKSFLSLLFLMLFGSVAFAQTGNPYPEHYNYLVGPSGANLISIYGTNASVSALVYINGVENEDYRYELGAYCGDMLRGGRVGNYFNGVHGLQYQFMIYGEAGDVMNFRLYDLQDETELDYVSEYTITYAVDGTYGTPFNPIIIEFFAPSNMVFAGTMDQNWSNVANWTVGGQTAERLPMSFDDVTIAAPCTLDMAAEVASVTVNTGASLTVDEENTITTEALTLKDGAQLIAPEGSEYSGTIEKEIQGYGNSVRGNYYFISVPVTEFDLATGFEAAGMLNGNYDLYFFTQNADNAGEIDENDPDTWWFGEWQNIKWYNNDESGMGGFAGFTDGNQINNAYLYANSETTTLSFNGMFNSGNVQYTCQYVGASEWPGYQLVGNPLPCNAIPVGGNGSQNKIAGYYMMNEQGRADVIAVENPIVAPATALLVKANSGNPATARRLTFVPTTEEATVRSANSLITIEVLSDNGALEDRAYVRNYESEDLTKFSLSNAGTKIFIPQNGKKYAAVYAGEAKSMPLCFTSSEGGIHTISVKAENMNCSYLHLIDNVTGTDIDLLRTPKYSFNADDSNYATRFKLVFDEQATNEIADNFAFISNGELMINNSGNATLQVMDITGRILSTENIQNCYSKSLNLSAGVYVVRLSNGNDVKAQKIVVE